MTGHEIFLFFLYTFGCMLGGYIGGVLGGRRALREIKATRQ